MDLNFRIIWFEDVDEWYNTLSRRLSRYISNKNLKVKIDRIKNAKDFSLSDYHIQNYDLLIVDYELEKVYKDDSEQTIYGSEVIDIIRKNKFVNDILFYSSHGFDVINQVMRNEGLQGVFVADRDNGEFIEIAHLLIDKTIRRTENLINIRGIVMDTTSDFDNKIRDLISILWKFLGEKEKTVADKIQKKILLDNKNSAEKLCAKYEVINSTNIDELLNQRELTAYRQARLLSWCIDANDEMKENLYNIIGKHALPEELSQANSFFELYRKNIITYRNALAHIKNSPEGEGTYYIGEIEGEQVPFDKQLCDKLRNTLIRYENILNEMYSYIESNF